MTVMLRLPLILVICLLLVARLVAETLYEDNFDRDGLSTNRGVGGGAISQSIHSHSWGDDGNASYRATGSSESSRALLFSKNSFQSDTGFKLTVRYYTDTIKDAGSHHLSIGLISSDSDLSNYDGFNPFRGENSIYSIGLNVTGGRGAKGQGINFSDGTISRPLDQSGSRAQFMAGKPTLLTLEIEPGGYWCYRIDGVYEASGVLVGGIDLNKSYHVAVYGQGSAGRKVLQFLKLETAYVQGERAKKSRGTWSGGMGLDKIQDLRTLDTIQVRLTDGAVLSASHWAPHKLLEQLWGGDVDAKGRPINLCVPRWGDLSLDEPEHDPIREKMLAIKAAGFQVKAYANCENFNGSNSKEFEVIAQRWKDYCDTNPAVVAFVESQPFHTGVWDRKKKRYVDASNKFPDRKYMFCYTELVLKQYALRYGDLIDAWIFDSAADINASGDNPNSDLIEEQRIYQAFAKAVHAGNPEIAIAFNNGRSTVKSKSFPFARPTRFDDFTFGHSFGGNNNHGDKEGGTFNRNYLHVKKMTETNGFVFAGGAQKWDDQIVGNMHSKLSTSGWKSGGKQAWEEADFLRWNLEAMQAGGIMTWDGSATSKMQRNWILRSWSFDLLKALDDHLAVKQFPGTPNWARAYTVLPNAVVGSRYHHELVVGKDLWDPEGDAITAITTSAGAPAWLTIHKDTSNPGHWVLSGVPTASLDSTVQFDLIARDSKGQAGTRTVEIHFVSR